MFWTAGSKGSEPVENFEWCSTDIGVKATAPNWAKATQEITVNDGYLTLDLKASTVSLSYKDGGGLNSVLCEVSLGHFVEYSNSLIFCIATLQQQLMSIKVPTKCFYLI